MRQSQADNFYGVAEFLAEFDIGRTKFYEEVGAGRIKAFKRGHRTLIRAEDAQEWAKASRQLTPVNTNASAWSPMRQLRFVVPEGTTTEAPKLQQLWREKGSGIVQWRPVERVVVSNQEFFGS